ncbi:hypothetical protein MAHJHV33_48540 [Mycobacterium avium subsp. hominissuis]
MSRAALAGVVSAARLILRGAEKNRARILIGADGRAMAVLPRLLGVAYAGLLARAARESVNRAARASRPA